MRADPSQELCESLRRKRHSSQGGAVKGDPSRSLGGHAQSRAYAPNHKRPWMHGCSGLATGAIGGDAVPALRPASCSEPVA